MFKKIRDYFDTKVDFVIMVDNTKGLNMLMGTFLSIGLDRIHYAVYDSIAIPGYLIEVRMPYNVYLKMMRCIQRKGYNLKTKSKIDILNELVKE